MKTIIINGNKTQYQATEDGKIFNIKTKKFLSGYVANNGYKAVLLTINGNKKNYMVHRIIAETFIPNDENLPIVNHIDGNKLNNNVDNLEWITASENRQHAILTQISDLAYGKRQKCDNINDNGWKQYKDTNYYVSKDGKVWNSKTKCLLKQTPNISGYIKYTLRINNHSYNKQAHVLVMETWGNKEKLSNQVINHIDGNKTNNDIENLELVTKSENMLHACYILKKNIKSIVRLSDNKEFLSISEAARELGITPGALTYALKNNSKCCNSYWKYK